MDALIFVDTNILLDFYRVRTGGVGLELHLLAPTIYRHKKTALGYGLKFWPEDFETLTGALPHLAAFQSYK